MCHHCHESGDGISRRELLVAAAGTPMVGGFLLRGATAAETAQVTQPESPAEWPEVHVAWLRPKEKYWLGWPGTAWDVKAYDGFLKSSRAQLEKFGRELKVRVTFEAEPLYDDAATDAFIAKVKSEKPKGVLLLPLHMQEWGRVGKIAQAGIPTIIFAGLGVCFTGHIQAISRQPGGYLISSPDWELNPVRFGLKMIRTAHEVRRTRIAVIAGTETKDEVLEPFGLQIRRIPRQRFPDTLKTIEETSEVVAVAEEYAKTAKKIVEPSRADLINASKNYFAAKKILEEEGCHGVTMDCLGLVRDRLIPTPPCMAWCKFLDIGLMGVCEADTNALMSQVLCCKLLDKPGFQQDPVPETVNNTFIGAHCVCPTKLNGFDKPGEPFILRSHAESNIGVSLQVLFTPGQEITIMQFVGPGKMILGKGKVLRNFDTPPAGGCRTSVELAIDGPADTRDTQGFHQLFIYGDHVRQFQAYGQMYGIKTEHI